MCSSDLVVLLVRQGGTWQAGRTRALYDPTIVQALAAAYGPADAHLEPHIAADLPTDYAQRHPTPTTHAATAARRHGDGPTGPGEGNGEHPTAGGRTTGPDPAPCPNSGDRAAGGHATGAHRSDGPDAGWGFDPTDADAVDQAAKGLVDRLDEFIAETVPPPEQATRLDDLNAARKRIDNTTAPEPIVQAVTAFLAERGAKGARRDELVERMKLGKSRAAEHLGALRTDGIITSAGNGKAARYYLPEHNE